MGLFVFIAMTLTSFSLVIDHADKVETKKRQKASIKKLQIYRPVKCVRVKFESDKRTYKVCL